MITKEQVERAAARLALCNECDFYLRLPKMCKKCHCVMPFKVQIEQAKCPIGKW